MPAPTTNPPASHFIPIRGLDLYYTEQGSGEPLLLIRADARTGASWPPYLTGCAAHYRVRLPDSRRQLRVSLSRLLGSSAKACRVAGATRVGNQPFTGV